MLGFHAEAQIETTLIFIGLLYILRIKFGFDECLMILSSNKIVAYLAFGIGVILFPVRTLACSCDIESPFLDVARQTGFVDLVVRGKVSPNSSGREKITQPFNLIELEVLEVIKGQEKRQTIPIWGDDGGLCRYPVHKLPVGTEWIMALTSITPSEGQNPYNSNTSRLRIKQS